MITKVSQKREIFSIFSSLIITDKEMHSRERYQQQIKTTDEMKKRRNNNNNNIIPHSSWH